MWPTENQQVLRKACENLYQFCSGCSRFFLTILRAQTGRRRVWVTIVSKWGHQAPEKISDFLETVAKSYACWAKGSKFQGACCLECAPQSKTSTIKP